MFKALLKTLCTGHDQTDVEPWTKTWRITLVLSFTFQDPPTGISGAPCENDIMKWNAVIFGYVSLERMTAIENAWRSA